MEDLENQAGPPESGGAIEPFAADSAGETEPAEQYVIADEQLKAILEAIIYITEEPVTIDQLANGVKQPRERIQPLIAELVAEYEKPAHGVAIREVAGGFKVATKAEHHEAVQDFVKSLKPPLKLSLPALETLAVVAYKQPVTGPEIMEIRGVQGAGVLKTLVDRKLIAPAGRKEVVGRPILYRTTKDFLVQFGLKDLSELPTLKELDEIRRLAFADDVPVAADETANGAAEAGKPEEEASASSGFIAEDAPAPAEE